MINVTFIYIFELCRRGSIITTFISWLHFIHADPNLALRGRATQSSTYSGITNAINAIDGNTDTNFYHGSCSCTNPDVSPWWRVDLLKPHKISQIVITNRGDCCGERLNGAVILVGNSLQNNGNNNPRSLSFILTLFFYLLCFQAKL